MQKVRVRFIRKKEIKELEKLFVFNTQKEFPEYSQNIRDYFTGKYKKRIVKSYIRLGAYVGQRMVGYLLADKPHGGIILVNWLAVLREFQKTGIGKALLERIDQIALNLGCHAIHLEADKRNLTFYSRFGYKEYGYDEKGVFGTDNYLLKKNLAEPDEKKFLLPSPPSPAKTEH